eukprot:TRINITY_DN2654_c1_g1_i6.p1 TRINITY_DN2654_c1_g1~~TRINITY_DN2654_c1_g1_i6.p1  ORF type:complete len:549 (-),score=79.43 TRINITY_DN2654_c1_g1_i6:1289-2935(-)
MYINNDTNHTGDAFETFVKVQQADRLRVIIYLLSNTERHLKVTIQACWTLAGLLNDMSSHLPIQEMRGIEALLNLLSTARLDNVLLPAITALINSTLYFPSIRREIMELGGLQILLSLIFGSHRAADSFTRLEVIKMIANLSITDEEMYCIEFRTTSVETLLNILAEEAPYPDQEKGVLSSLSDADTISQIHSPLQAVATEWNIWARIKALASIALENISFDEEVLEVIGSCGGLDILRVHLLASSSPRLQYHAVRLLSVWATSESLRMQFQATGGLHELNKVWQSYQQANNSPFLKAITLALENMSIPTNEITEEDEGIDSSIETRDVWISEGPDPSMISQLSQIEAMIQAMEAQLAAERKTGKFKATPLKREMGASLPVIPTLNTTSTPTIGSAIFEKAVIAALEQSQNVSSGIAAAVAGLTTSSVSSPQNDSSDQQSGYYVSSRFMFDVMDKAIRKGGSRIGSRTMMRHSSDNVSPIFTPRTPESTTFHSDRITPTSSTGTTPRGSHSYHGGDKIISSPRKNEKSSKKEKAKEKAKAKAKRKSRA